MRQLSSGRVVHQGNFLNTSLFCSQDNIDNIESKLKYSCEIYFGVLKSCFRSEFDLFGKAACCYWDGCNADWFVATGPPSKVLQLYITKRFSFQSIPSLPGRIQGRSIKVLVRYHHSFITWI